MKKTSASLPTKYGEFTISVYPENDKEHTALVKGEVRKHNNVYVRIHSECLTGDAFSSLRCDCSDQLNHSFKFLSQQKQAILIYLRQEGRGIGLFNKIRAYNLQEHGLDTVEANTHLGFAADEREYSAAAKILKDLGVNSVKLLTNNPKKVLGLERHGIIVNELVPIKTEVHQHNRHYLNTKKEKMGHNL